MTSDRGAWSFPGRWRRGSGRHPTLAQVALWATVAVLACAEPVPPQPADTPEGAAAATAFAAAHPDSVRDRLARALRLAARAPTDSGRTGHLAVARLQARAYAEAWSDSFLVRRVERFEAAPAAARRRIADADSLYRAGRLAYGQEGVPAAMRLWRQSLRNAEAADDSAGFAAALYGIGAGFSVAGDLDSARVYLERAARIARAIGDHRTTGNAVGTLANVARDEGEPTRAAELYREASGIRARSGDRRGMAADENSLGLLARDLGDLDGASRAFERALGLNRAAGRDRAAAVNLTNLGDIASIRGDYAVADARYGEALDLNRSAGDLAETAYALHDLGLLAARRGDYVAALATLSEALTVHEASGAVLEGIAVRADLAAVQGATGDLGGALSTLRHAREDAEREAAPPSTRAALALARADVAVQMASHAQADAEYRVAEGLFREAGDDAGRADAQEGRALLLLLRDDPDGAVRLLDLAERTRDGAGDARAAARTRLLTGEVRRNRGDTVGARRAIDDAWRTFEQLGDAPGEAAALSALGRLALDRGTPIAAEDFYRRGLARLGRARAAELDASLRAGLADALRALGALDEAAAELRAAVGSIENVALSLPGEQRRSGFLAGRWQVYASLALVEQERGRAAEAFRVSERMRARQLLEALQGGRVATRDDAPAREQDLRRHIGELMRRIEASGAEAVERREPALAGASLDADLEALAEAQREYADLLTAMRVDRSAYVWLVEAAPVGWHDVAARLSSGEVFLQYLVTDSAASVFVVTADTVAAIALEVGRAPLANLVDFARLAMGRPDGDPAVPLWQGALRRLHHYLIEPVDRAGYLEGARSVVISPYAELHFLPFGALLDGEPDGRFLVERFDIAYAPSASVWVRMGRRTVPEGSRVLALAPHTTRLPASSDEVAGIRSVFGRGRTTLLLGPRASERALRAGASAHDILHLATFGVFNKHNPLFSYVELAPGGGADGRLEVHEVYDLELDGQLIVLSACQTAVGSGALADVPAGDDWVGLMHAFIQAGAGGVLASLWPVDDRATARLMEGFYRGLDSGRSGAGALADAQRAILADPVRAHPFYWAGFVMSGARKEE